MAICVHCGRQIREDARFCGICGGEQPTSDDLAALGIGKAADEAEEELAERPESWQERWRSDQESVEQAEQPLSQDAVVAAEGAPAPLDAAGGQAPYDAAPDDAASFGAQAPEKAKRSGMLPLLLAGLVGVVAGLVVMLVVVRPWQSTGGVGKPAEAETAPLVLRISAEKLDADGSRVPVRVTGSGSSDYQKDAFVGLDGTTVELPAGTYTVEALGSPIASDGTLYAYDGATAEVVVGGSDNVEDADAPALVLEPLDPADVTDEQIAAAVGWASKDEDRADVAESLGEAARSARDSAGTGAIADAYAQVLDSVAALDFGAAAVSKYGYALVDMTADGVPELLVAAWVDPADWFYKVMVYDEATRSAVQVGETTRYYTFREVLCSYADGHALLQSGYYGSRLNLTEHTISGGELVSTAIGQYTDEEAPSLEELGATEIELVDAGDRTALDALRTGK